MKPLPRVTYSNTGEDFSGVHAQLDTIMADAQARLLGKSRAGFIAGGDRSEGRVVAARSPIDRDIVLGEFPQADVGLVDAAVRSARSAAVHWNALGWPKRAAILRAGADVIEQRKWDVAIACLIEVGKSRLEALGEVEEAIDLIRHYCDEMERTDGYRQDMSGASSAERCNVVMRPYGVFGVIAPFNFPVALSLGMMSAALVAGNTVVFKPSDAAGLTGRLVVEALVEGGFPDGVLNLVYGGAETGRALVEHPLIDGIAFTGSNAVGMTILRHAAASQAMKPVLAEMGGKNPAFVCESADLAIAASGVARSAFGLSGQKCSALSKVYVARSMMDDFLEALTDTASKLKVGDPRQQDVFMGPVIDAAAVDRFERAVGAVTSRRPAMSGGNVSDQFIAAAGDVASKASVLIGGERMSGSGFDRGHFVQPTVVVGLPPDHGLNHDELFLPLLSVLPLDSFMDALEDANHSPYGLTAGIYTQDKRELDWFLDEMQAGVLYANRASGATTGAWPGFQTFCGWKGSGTTGKGGLGSWYVPQFMREQSRTIFGTL